jgi:putative membrane protein (TIGR04086 family)
MYLLFLYVFSSIINSNFSLNIRSIIIILLGMFCGVIGGILGVNKR